MTGDLEGPVMFVANHPNSLVDPALLFVVTNRPITFLAKAPLFDMPLLGWLLRGLGALPVYRRQDDPTQMARNEGTLDAAVAALVSGGAITIFPEGRSHSEPGLADLKTGGGRIAVRAAREGASVRIVPVGLSYADKNRFRSAVLVEVGAPVPVLPRLPADADFHGERAVVQALTDDLASALSRLTLDLERWEDLPLIQTAEQLYALRAGGGPNDPDRLRRFARGISLFRAEQPERFEALRTAVTSYQTRLDLMEASPADLRVAYRPTSVARFVGRNLLALAIGFPLFGLGVLLFALPFLLTRHVTRWLRPELDRVATYKLIATLVVAPSWWASLVVAAWLARGPALGVVTLVAALPLALFTRRFYERRRAALADVRTFFSIGTRRSLRAALVREGDTLAAEIEALATELRERVM
jgi:1-acyl-sn-glycerol-3-phosphate acyltransferase